MVCNQRLGLSNQSPAPHYARWSILSNSFLPAPIATPMTETGCAQRELKPGVLERTPMGSWAHPEEVAYQETCLASDQWTFVTGSEPVIDCGWSAQ